MAPTTVTTILLVLAGLGLLTLSGWTWLGSWQPAARRERVPDLSGAEVEQAVREMRAAIEAYERSQRPH
jgi:type II secretory pathway component PulM